MKNVMVSLLEKAGYANASTLVEIFYATPNPEVAFEKFLGIYVAPQYPCKGTTDQYGNCTVKGYNPFTKEISFEGYQRKTTKEWYIIGKPNVTFRATERAEAAEHFQQTNDLSWRSVTTHELETELRNSSISLESWLNHNKPVASISNP